MIQDIFPYRLDHAFRDREPEPEDCFFSFRGGEVLLRVSEDGSRRIPVFHDLGMPFAEVRRLAVFLFCVDGVTVYLLRQQGDVLPERKGMQYLPLRELDGILPGWAYFAGATALHLAGWYERNVYCGRCEGVRAQDRGRRSLSCPDCGDTVYPAIAPVVMVAVTDGDRLLMTKYGDRPLPQWVLVSGFVEAGETLEEAAEREVYEETGIRIRGLKYFGSQPWGFSGSVIAGYTAELDGSDQLRMPVALRMVYEVCKTVDVPVIGIGGIATFEDALEFIMAGAAAVAVGTANFHNPYATVEVIEGIRGYLEENDIASLDRIRGIVD